MRRSIIFLIICLQFLCIRGAFAQINEELIGGLNRALDFELKLKRQCEYNRDKFDVPMPYHRIILEKEDKIGALTDLIPRIGGKISAKGLAIDKGEFLFGALNSDAYYEIQLVQIYDAILAKFGHPEVIRFISPARNHAYQHFMLLTNMAQKVMYENLVDKRLKSSK